MNIIVIGGGIGGLTSAVALKQKGFNVTVYEKSPTFSQVGSGLGIGANALNVLDKLGMKKEILKNGKLLTSMEFLTETGKTITKIDAEVMKKRFGAENVTIHRKELHKTLKKALEGSNLYTNKNCVDFYQDEQGVTVSFEDGEVAQADAVIAADGVQSFFRRKLLPKSMPRYAGYTCWRGVISDHQISFTDHVSIETWGPSGRFGIVPLGKGQIYWFTCVKAQARDPQIDAYKVNDLLRIFGSYHNPIPQIIKKTANEALIHNDIVDIKPIPQYAFGRVALLGDAAHATTPNLGQGAGQAMEDAYVLANVLEQKKDIPLALKAYERKRLSRTRKIITMSSQVGKIAQMENRFLIPLRNAALRVVPSSISMKSFHFLYSTKLE